MQALNDALQCSGRGVGFWYSSHAARTSGSTRTRRFSACLTASLVTPIRGAISNGRSPARNLVLIFRILVCLFRRYSSIFTNPS